MFSLFQPKLERRHARVSKSKNGLRCLSQTWHKPTPATYKTCLLLCCAIALDGAFIVTFMSQECEKLRSENKKIVKRLESLQNITSNQSNQSNQFTVSAVKLLMDDIAEDAQMVCFFFFVFSGDGRKGCWSSSETELARVFVFWVKCGKQYSCDRNPSNESTWQQRPYA